jgi:hypothetical protein
MDKKSSLLSSFIIIIKHHTTSEAFYHLDATLLSPRCRRAFLGIFFVSILAILLYFAFAYPEVLFYTIFLRKQHSWSKVTALFFFVSVLHLMSIFFRI